MFPPIRTGTSNYSNNLADSLSNEKNDILVITIKNNEAVSVDDKLFDVVRIPALHLPLKNYFKHLRFCSFFPNNYKKVNSIALQFKPDIMLLINHYLDIAFPAIYAAKKNKIPLYISIGTQLQSLNPIRNKVLKILDRIIVGKMIFPFSNKIIAWDKEIERYLLNVHSVRIKDKIRIIAFGANGDIGLYMNHQHNYASINQILGVGAIIEQRDYCYQIRVFNELLKKFPNLILKIVGHVYIEKPILLAKELGIEKKVIFTGEISHSEVLEEYKKSCIHWMMLNGEYVGLGTSTLESMLMGVPSISNSPENLFGNNSLKDYHNYIHSDGMTIEKDVEKISFLIENQPERERIGKAGREFIVKYMNWPSVAKQYMELFNRRK